MTSETLGAQRLLQLSEDELDDLFRSVDDPGPIPDGEADGTVIIPEGTEVSETAAKVAHLLAWRGKVFDSDRGVLVNKIGPLGTHAVQAKVYADTSWFDGRP